MTRRRFVSKPGALVLAAGLLLLTSVTFADQAGDAARRSTRDGVYSKTQAEAGKATFDKFCAGCHDFKPSAKSSLSPDLAGDEFLTRWNGKPVRELTTLVLTTMPNDGSAVLTEDQVADVVAYVLQQNKFPAGAEPLKHTTSASITIVK